MFVWYVIILCFFKFCFGVINACIKTKRCALISCIWHYQRFVLDYFPVWIFTYSFYRTGWSLLCYVTGRAVCMLSMKMLLCHTGTTINQNRSRIRNSAADMDHQSHGTLNVFDNIADSWTTSKLVYDIPPPDIPPGQFPSPPSYDIPPVVKAKLALTHTPDPNRSTAVNFVHVNGRSLYIIDWLMVAVEDVLQHVKGGELSGRRKCPAGNGSGGYVKGEMYERIPSKHRVNISQYLQSHTYNKHFYTTDAHMHALYSTVE